MAVINTGRQKVMYLNDSDLTLDGRVIDPAFGYNPVDVTTFNDSSERNQPGNKTATVSFSGLYNSTAQRTWDALTGALANGAAGTFSSVSVYLETDAPGAPGVGMSATFPSNLAPAGAPGEAEEMSCEFVQQNTWHSLTSLVGKGSVTNDATGTVIDRGAASTAGGVLYAHIFAAAASGGSAEWTVRLQDASTATGTYVDRATLTVGSGTVTGSAISFTGTFRRFVRVFADRDATSGTLEYQAGFAAG